MPPRETIRVLNQHGTIIHDLDALLVKTDMEAATPYLPRVYCAILRTVMLNALYMDFDALFIDTGPGKCDNAMYVATILADHLELPVIQTKNLDMLGTGYPICRSTLPLLDKLAAITEQVKIADPDVRNLPSCLPVAGFWGVPPRDFSILSLFPDHTHVYGWSRCMENKTPADLDLETYCNPAIPTVFFAQSFCGKTALAQHLARRHPRALCVDADVTAGGSLKAKIQAFLELSGAYQ